MENTDHISRIKLLNGEPTFQNTQVVPTRYQLLNKTSHVVKYDNETNNATWVFEILNKETIDGPATVQSEYRLDYSTHKDHRAPESLKKYTKTGFQRGHLAAAANHKWCQKARDDTNLLSNIAPQHKDLNQRKWKDLENLCRLNVQDNYSKAYIYTGPLYHTEKYITEKGITEETIVEKEKEKIESSMRDFMSKYGKALPTHFFKVIILEKDNGERDLKCYEMPNKIEGEEEQEEQQQREEEQQQREEEQRRRQREEEQRQQQIQCIENKLSSNSKNIDEIERASGLRFTREIPENLRNRKVEVTVEFKTEEEQKNIPNIDIIPIHYVRSEM
ncbi:endonuclease G, mitochondrial-like isoform X2 [Paramisgurnus dabryanus]|uniref:endonuclease G, mitochondrial-like isoform X2 n=1 Tax=Paramisgurnus dabryanus TaxID=90735 RepID=UPI0031F44A9F